MVNIYESIGRFGYAEIYDETGQIGGFVARVNGEFYVICGGIKVTVRADYDTGSELVFEAFQARSK